MNDRRDDMTLEELAEYDKARAEAEALESKRRTEILAQLHHKLLDEPYEQPSAAEVEEVAWWEACELDRVVSDRDHCKAEIRRLRDENGRLRSEISVLRSVNGGFRG